MHKNVHIPLILSSNFYSQDYENAFARVRSDSERSAVSAHVAVDEQFRLPPSVAENVSSPQPRPYRTLQALDTDEGLQTDDTPEFGKCRNPGCDEECNPQEQTCHSCRMGISPAMVPFSGSYWVHAAQQNAQDMMSRENESLDLPTVNAVMMDETNDGLDAAITLAELQVMPALSANDQAVSSVLLDSLDNLLGDFNPTPQSE